MVYWKIAAGHRPTSIFSSKKIAAGGVKLSHPIRNRVKKHLSIYPFLIPFKERVIGDRWSSKIVVSQKSCSVFFRLFLFWWKSLNNIHQSFERNCTPATCTLSWTASLIFLKHVRHSFHTPNLLWNNFLWLKLND